MPLKVRDIVRIVEADGWVFSRRNGSHRQHKHPTKKGTVTIAGKPGDDLKPGTESSIRRQTGI